MFMYYKIMEVMAYIYQMWYNVYDHEEKNQTESGSAFRLTLLLK